MKSFSTFLNEAPISDGDYSHYSETPKTKAGGFITRYSAQYFRDKFESNFKTVGNGSSRIVFQCDVPLKLFSETHQEVLEVGDGETVKTVLKLATSGKGVQQNTFELQTWNELKYDDYADYLAPIVDWSGNPRYSNHSQYVLDINNYNTDINFVGDLKGAFWIQMAYCEPAMKNVRQFMQLFTEKFGPIDFDDPTMGYKADPLSLENIHCFIHSKRFAYTYKRVIAERERMLDEGTLSGEQFDALYGLIDMAVAHGIQDIAHPTNWGIFNGRPVILDYGYDKRTDNIYYRKDKIIFNVYVDPTGAVRIKYKEK